MGGNCTQVSKGIRPHQIRTGMMSHSTYKINFRDLDITKTQLLDILGQGDGSDHDFMSVMIDESMKDASEAAEVRAEYRIFDNIRFDNPDKALIIEDQVFKINKTIFTQLKRSEAIAIFLCTAGQGPGRKSHNAMQEGDPLKSYVLDVIGSEIVEETGVLMMDEIEKYASSKKKKITGSFSPGYCGWDVAEQHKLFHFFPDNFSGIKLTTSALMDPVKSVSGIIGIGRNVRKNSNTCSFCELKECIFREARQKKMDRMGN